MRIHTFRNDAFQTVTTVHELHHSKGTYFRVVHVDKESGEIVGAVRCPSVAHAMETAKKISAGETLPGDLSPSFVPKIIR